MKPLALVGLIFMLPIFAHTAKLEPLIGSAWAKRNPHKLPYSTCYIYIVEVTAGIVKNYTAWTGPLVLHCETRQMKYAPHGLKFSIPLEVSVNNLGLTGVIGVAPLVFNVFGLQGKSVLAIFDHYKGHSISIGLPALGIIEKGYRSEGNIRLNTMARTLYAGIEIGKSKIVIKPASHIKNKWCLDNEYIINNKITQTRDQKYCDDLKIGLEKGQKPNFDLSHLENLNFIFKGKH